MSDTVGAMAHADRIRKTLYATQEESAIYRILKPDCITAADYIESLVSEIVQLRCMVENGLGPKDMERDL